MLTIRNTQLQALAKKPREQFVREMQNHLYEHFPTEAWRLTPEELYEQTNTLVNRAGIYGLLSRQQVCRFINLAAHYGWEFDSDPELRWMHAILIDPALDEPGQRLDRLVETCLHRQAVEERNRALKPQLQLHVSTPATIAEKTPSQDYAGHELKKDLRPLANTAAELIARNPQSYHLSKSLWFAPELVPLARSTPEALDWAPHSTPLIRGKDRERHASGK